MKERPIIFSGEMVRAILEGRKSQTRRVVKLREFHACTDVPGSDWYFRAKMGIWSDVSTALLIEKYCPYGKPGDRLWVRETWAYCSKCANHVPEDPEGVLFRAEDESFNTCHVCDPVTMEPDYRWRPSIYMPRWASRILLEVVRVRVERVQSISEEDAKAEGAIAWNDTAPDHGTVYKPEYRMLWDKINGKRGFGWEVNPWVWVVEFRRM